MQFRRLEPEVLSPEPEKSNDDMATTAKIAKEHKKPKFKIRLRNRCHLCGRPRAYMRKFAPVPSVLPEGGSRGRRHGSDEE